MLQNPPNWLSSNAIHTFQTFWRARHFFNFTFDGQKWEIKILKIQIFFEKSEKIFLIDGPEFELAGKSLKMILFEKKMFGQFN